MIDHINIVVADLERAAQFYHSVFGFARGFSATLEGEWISAVTGLPHARAQCLFLDAPAGGARIELIRYDAPAADKPSSVATPNQFGLRHIAFEVDDMDATLLKMRDCGISPISAPVEVPFRVANLGTKKLAYFYDFDGTLVEIASYKTD